MHTPLRAAILESISILAKYSMHKQGTLSASLQAYATSTESSLVEGDITALLTWLRNPRFRPHTSSDFPKAILSYVHEAYWNTPLFESVDERDITRFIRSFTKAFRHRLPYIAVQSPLPLSSEMKKEIALQLEKKYGLSFPIFHSEPGVLGGLRIFVDGECLDNSWQKRIDDLFSALHTYTH